MVLSKGIIIITNNRDCASRFQNEYDCHFNEGWDYGQVLREARDLVHRQYSLLSHPMAGSLKPNQTPYRSIILTDRISEEQKPFESLYLIENALETYTRFQRNSATPAWPENILKDFRTIDLALIEPAVARWKSACLEPVQ